MLRAAALRFALIWLLALCLPVQMAVAQWRACCWQLAGLASGHHAHAHGHAPADAPAAAADAAADEPAGQPADALADLSGTHHHTSACASCCAGAFWPAVAPLHPPQTSAQRVLTPVVLDLPSPVLPGLERPPRLSA